MAEIYKREDLLNNILRQSIIRIDFLKIENIEDMIASIDRDMQQKGYKLVTDIVSSVDINISDPDPLITQDIIAKKTTNKSLNYIFQKDGHRFIINEYMMIFENNNFDKYLGIEVYLKVFEFLLTTIIKQDDLSFQRIGIRKINSIIVNDIQKINDYFKNIDLENEIISINDQLEINNTKKLLVMMVYLIIC